jgi:hypothetical protein
MKQNIFGAIGGLTLGVGISAGNAFTIAAGAAVIIWSAYELYKACKG